MQKILKRKSNFRQDKNEKLCIFGKKEPSPEVIWPCRNLTTHEMMYTSLTEVKSNQIAMLEKIATIFNLMKICMEILEAAEGKWLRNYRNIKSSD